MPFWSKIAEFDRKYPSSSLGTAIGLLIGLFGIYIALFYEKHPQLRYDILSQAPVYSIRENVGDLDIMFKGENIRQKHESLSVITLRVSNPGSSDIELGSFDPQDLPGFEVTEGKIIVEPEIIHTTSPYLKKTVKLVALNDRTYTISPLILDRDQSFTVKLLVLSPEVANPQVRSFGKIAGVPRIDVTAMPPSEEHRSLWWRTFSGDTVVQVLRCLAYTIGTFAVIGGLVGLISAIAGTISKRHRRHLVRKFGQLLGHDPTYKEHLLFKSYIELGESFIVQLNAAFSDRALLGKRVREFRDLLDPAKPKSPEQAELFQAGYPHYALPPISQRIIPILMRHQIVELDGDRLIVDEQTAGTASKFESFLMANDPDKVRTAKEPYGSEVHVVENVTSLPATQRPENE